MQAQHVLRETVYIDSGNSAVGKSHRTWPPVRDHAVLRIHLGETIIPVKINASREETSTDKHIT